MKKIAFFLSILLIMGSLVTNAQTRNVTGTVTSVDDGMGIPGVSVSVKGTTLGTITNIDGEFELKVPEEAKELLVSFVGMKTQAIAITGATSYDISMEPNLVGIDEVVVTALGIKREKRSITYQTEKVTSEELVSGASSKASDGLIGKVAGLTVNAQSNGVNPQRQILLRGMRSISANNEALIVIDGSIATTGAFNDLNPNDIESVNVLKGATAAALYGSQAANGALIVETKSGQKASKVTVGINHSTTFEDVAYMPDFQTKFGSGWDGEYNNIENTNWGPRFDGQMRQIGPTMPEGYVLPTQMVPYAPAQNNALDFYERGVSMSNTVYLSGGDETSAFYMSLGQQDNKGIIPDDEYKRYTAKANASKTIGDVTFKVNTTFKSDETNVVGDDIGDQDRSMYWFILNTPANIPLSTYKDWSNPETYGHADNYYNAFYQNPYWAIGTNRDIDNSKRFVGNLSADWDITSNINVLGRVGANNAWGYGKNWRARQEYNEDLQPYHSTVTSFVDDSEFQSSITTADLIFSGNFDLANDFTLTSILGTSGYMTDYRNSSITANNLSIPDFYDISNGTGQLSATVDQRQKRTFGFYGDLTFGYKNWAFVTLTGRQDYTSTLSSDNNSYFYPAIGVSAVLTDAIPTLGDNDFLSYMKVTLNNSTVYNDLAPYQINERYSQSGAFPFGSLNGFAKSNTAVDTNIKKEKLGTTELSLNMAFLDSRFTLDASYYNTVTTDLITNTTPSIASGANRYLTNIGQLTGNGFELSLGGRVLNIGDLQWDLNLNYYTHTTTVDEIIGDLKEVGVETRTGYGTFAIVDESFPYLKAVSYERDAQGRVIVDAASGDPVVGEIKKMGRTTPKHTVGMNTVLKFKGFTFSTTFDYRTGHVYYAVGQDMMEFTGRSLESVAGDRKDFVWPNSVIETSPDVFVENTNIPITDGRMTFWQNRYNEIKENYVKDATALKIREMSLMYSLPRSLLNKQDVFQRVSIGAVGRNLYTWLPQDQSTFSDPEFGRTQGNNSVNDTGVGGYDTNPPTRSLGFNVIVEF